MAASMARRPLHPARSLEGYAADPMGSYATAGRVAAFWFHEGLNGVMLWGRPDEVDVDVLARALAIEIPQRAHRHASLVDLRRLECFDVGSLERLSSGLASWFDAFGPAVTRQALLLPCRPAAVAAEALASLRAPFPIRPFTDPVEAMGWLGLLDLSLLDELERIHRGCSAAPSLLTAVRGLMDAAPSTTLPDLSRQLGYSQRTLQRRLHELGTTFQRECADARLRIAKQLMRETTYPLKWIAGESGWASLHQFSSFFHKRVGTTASRWRAGDRG
jgi:AraC-like DNA-binding protein